jgi:hypothetical protein
MPTPGDVVAEWRRDDVRRIRVTVLLGFVLAFVALAIVAALRGSVHGALLCTVVAVAELGVAACFSVWTNRSHVVLTQDEVVDRVGKREVRVPLTGIRAVLVGGTYRRGWATWLVLDEGRSVRLGAPAFVFLDRRKVYRPAGATYWRELSESPCGRQAALIHAAARLPDGSAEILRTHPLRSEVARWWSPSGESSLTIR